MNDRLAGYFKDHNDMMVKPEQVDERTVFAVKLGTIIVRTLDQMGGDARLTEQKFELGSGEGQAFEIIVRKKA